MIKYQIGSTTTEVRQWKFPDGCVGIDINNLSMDVQQRQKVDLVLVDIRFGSKEQLNDDIMALVFATRRIRKEYPLAKMMLNMPYIPYSRQDRPCNNGEGNSIADFADVINMLKYDVVAVLDPHSNVSPAVLHNCQVFDQLTAFGQIKPSFREWTIVAPDAGATKKCEEFAKAVGAAGVLTCHKTREMSTGKITGLEFNQKVDPQGKFLVLDDICDGGRTFIELAKMFGECDLELAVTHGIFSKGVDIVTDWYDHVYTTDSLFRGDPSYKLTVIKI